MGESSKLRGRCCWFSEQKGYGFITLENQQKDIFVHYSQIRARGNGFRKLDKNDLVEFSVEMCENGKPQAIGVTKLEEVAA